MRVFIALLFPKLIKDELFKTVETLQGRYKGNFTSYENLHLTLYYIGEVNEALLMKIIDGINQIEYPNFDIKTSKLSSFKNSTKHCLVHVKVDLSSQLKVLQKKVLMALEKSGVIIDNSNFSPHITLGRKVEISYHDLDSFKTDQLDIPIIKISIMESKRVIDELVYEEIAFKELI